MRYKIILPDAAIKASTTEQRAPMPLLSWQDYTDTGLEVLGLPFGGVHEGRDRDGETFTRDTEFWIDDGVVPVTYFHGFGVGDDPWDVQDPPAVIGVAKVSRVDDAGVWFDLALDVIHPLAKRVLANVDGARASSGAVAHLVRVDKSGIIGVWPVGELAVFDINAVRQPANELAIIRSKPNEIAAQAVDSDAVMGQSEDGAGKLDNKLDNKEVTTMDDTIINPKDDMKIDAAPIDTEKSEQPDWKTIVREAVAEELNKALPSQPVKSKAAPVIISERGDDPVKRFMAYIRGKAALQEGTDSEGGYLVPDEFLPRIIAKRDELSVPRQAGAMVVQTSRDVLNVAAENSSMTTWTITVEEGAYDENEPTFSQAQITMYKFTKLLKISEELIEDQAANLEAYIGEALGRSWAMTENQYTIAGSGVGQPQGILTGGTAALTLDAVASISAAEIPELYHKLGEPYTPGAVWTMRNSTLGYLRGLTGNSFMFQPTPAGGRGVLYEAPYILTDYMEAPLTASKKPLAIGNWAFYCLAERRGMTIRRLNELYAANGQVGILASVRMGGAVLQAEAFQYATAPAA